MRIPVLLVAVALTITSTACDPVRSKPPRPDSTIAPNVITPQPEPPRSTSNEPEFPAILDSYCRHVGSQAFSATGELLVCTSVDEKLLWQQAG